MPSFRRKPTRRVAVIGAGPSGLTATRQALQNGFKVCVFERLDGIGGAWKMATDLKAQRRPIPALSALTMSKQLCAFSELPVPEQFPTFLRPIDGLAYLRLYAQKFGLEEHIRLGTEVREVRRAPDWQENGKWLLRWANLASNEEHEEEFDAVLLCTGMRQRSWRPPEWRLEKQFKGRVIHAEQFKSPADFANQTVCVVGLGQSAVEIAAGLAHSAKQVLLSTRRGGWLLNRQCRSGEPADRHFHSRWHSQCRQWVPKLARSKFWEWTADSRSLLSVHPSGDKRRKPSHSLLSSHLTFGADQLGWHLATGAIRLKPDIWSFSAGNSVEFVDGSVEDGVDAIILCTGYQFDFGMVEQGALLAVRHNDFHLYKHMFSPELAPHHNLAVIGHVQPIGGCIWPIAELQARLFFAAIQGTAALPEPFWMKAELEKRRCGCSVNFVKTRRHTQLEDQVQFCVELAKMIGIDAPPFHRLLLEDPRLGIAIWFGPFCSAQFRLWGPNRQEDARKDVLESANNGCWHWHCLDMWSWLLIGFAILIALFGSIFG